MILCTRSFPIFAVLFIFAAQTFAAESLEQTIDYLINSVGKSNATFVRNGTSHSPTEAVSQIKTPEDFIQLCASKSLVTGKPYLVRTPDGKEMHLDVWLADALRKYRSKT